MKDTLALALIRAERCKAVNTWKSPAAGTARQLPSVCHALLLQAIFDFGRGLRVPLDRSDVVVLDLPPS
jgi:hypothetical protein